LRKDNCKKKKSDLFIQSTQATMPVDFSESDEGWQETKLQEWTPLFILEANLRFLTIRSVWLLKVI